MINHFRKRWPGLIKKVQFERGKHFKKKPSLKLGKAPPKNELWQTKIGRRGKWKVTKARVVLPRKLVRDFPEKFSIIAGRHELVENLLLQNGYSPGKAHRIARKDTRRNTWRLTHHHHRKAGLNYYLAWTWQVPSLGELFQRIS